MADTRARVQNTSLSLGEREIVLALFSGEIDDKMVHLVIYFLMQIFVSGFLYSSTPSKSQVKEAPKAPVAAKKPPVNLPKLIDAVQTQYNNTKAARFDFEQSYKHPFLNVTETSKGVVIYSRAGGKMLWSYLEPANRQKKFFINGNRFTYYSINDKIAYSHDCYDQETLSASVAFLLGTGNLRQSFTISLLEGESPNPALTWLVLVPKESNSPVKKLFLGIDKTSKVAESLVEDPSGGKNHFKFLNFNIVSKLDDKLFVFTPPPGVKIEPVPNIKCPVKKTPPKSAPFKKKTENIGKKS